MSKVVHQIASCIDCGKNWESYRNARLKGYNHAKATGHKVSWETTIAGFYKFEKEINK